MRVSAKRKFLREIGKEGSRKRQAIQSKDPFPEHLDEEQASRGSEQDLESDIEYEAMTIPDLPCELTHENEIQFPYQRTAQPCRMTKWRKHKTMQTLQAAAVGSADIRSFFANQPAAIPPKLTRSDIVTMAIHDLQKKIRHDQLPSSTVNNQSRARFQAVLYFLNNQNQDQTSTRIDLALHVARCFNRGVRFAKNIITWERMWIKDRIIPHGRQGAHIKVSSVLNDEDTILFVREYIAEKKEAITASALADAVGKYLGSKSIASRLQTALEANSMDFGPQKSLSVSTEAARCWLRKMGYSWRGAVQSVYFDGHERPDVVAYRKQFVRDFLGLESKMANWDDDGNLLGGRRAPDGSRWIVVVTHDESTFQVNDGRRHMWLQNEKDPLRRKGAGKGIMVSEFLTPRGRLCAPSSITDDELEGLPRHATQFLEYGPDNHWTGEKMAQQTLDIALPLFEVVFPSQQFQGLFCFDNASNHRSMPDDALIVNQMNLGPGGKHQRQMRDGWNTAKGEPQAMQADDGNAKGIRQILIERALWPATGLKLQCKSNNHNGQLCCARQLLGSQCDFQAQKGLIQEAIEARGHLVMFYPKFHCELNFIEYFWASCKRFTRDNCNYRLEGLRRTIPDAMASVSSSTIAKYFAKVKRILLAYQEGIEIGSSAYKERVYKSHRRVTQA